MQVTRDAQMVNWRTVAGVFMGCLAIMAPNTPAQIVPDNTLPTPSSVETGCTVCTIEGGTLQGDNLFHSFREFSVSEGGEAIFNNLDSIEHIFSRVTGDSMSNIDGFIRANGTANVFLLNPNGIIFGPNAQLDIGGSFVSSTANAIQFGDQAFYSASDPASSSLLTIDPSAFFFTGHSTGSIENQSTAPAGMDSLAVPLRGLRVPDGQSLILVGGNIALNGGGLNASGGRIELVSLAGPGTAELNVNGSILDVTVFKGSSLSDISLSNEAAIQVSGESSGDIEFWGNRLMLDGNSLISANILGSGNGGVLAVTATESIQLHEGSLLESSTVPSASGNAGDITITTPVLLIQDGAQISTSTFGSGAGGNLIVNASDFVQLIGTNDAITEVSGLFARVEDEGKAGNLIITTKNLILQDGAQISVSTRGAGAGGRLDITASELVQVVGASANGRLSSSLFATARSTGRAGIVRITTKQLSVRDGGVISAGSFDEGSGGTLIINVSDSVFVTDARVNPRFPNGIFTQAQGTGNAGELQINTGNLIVSGGSLVSSVTFRSGAGGRFSLNASESVQITGTTPNGQISSGLYAGSVGTGRAGDLEIVTPTLLIQDMGVVSSLTRNGRGGSIEITAHTLETTGGGQVRVTTLGSEDAGDITLSGLAQIRLAGRGSGLFANTEEVSSGNGGSILIPDAPREVTLRDGARIAVDSQGTGRGGDIRLASEVLILDNESLISAETDSNTGGNIGLQIGDILLLRRGSQISTTAGGDGGDITISAPNGFIVAVPAENSDIRANAIRGRGGDVNITAQGIFGIEPRDKPTDLSDITASSDLGVDGIIQINDLSVDPNQGLAELPSTVVDVSRLVAQGCDQPITTGQNPQGEFYNTGRGGIIASPTAVLGSTDILEDLQPPEAWQADAPGNGPITEAQGWLRNDAGEVMLVAEPSLLASQQRCWR